MTPFRAPLIALLVGAATSLSVLPGLVAPAAAADTVTLSGAISADEDLISVDVDVDVYRLTSGGSFDLVSSVPVAEGGAPVQSFSVSVETGGTYKLALGGRSLDHQYLTEFYDDQSSLEAADPIVVGAADVTTAAVVLERGPSIEGRITDSDGGAVADVQVEATNADTGQVYEGYTDQIGVYSIQNVPDGDYKLEAKPSPSRRDLLGEWYLDKPTELSADPVTVDGADLSGRDFTLAFASSITGRLTVPAGTDPSAATVTAFQDRVAVADGTVDPDGTYAITGLTPGTYSVGFNFDGSEPFRPEYYPNVAETRGVDQAAQLQVLPESARQDVDETLSVGGTITGRVLNADGQPFVGFIQAPGAEPDVSQRYAFTDTQGRFSVRGLSTARYKLNVASDPDNRFVLGWYPGGSSTSQARARTITISDPARPFSAGTLLIGDVQTLRATRAPRVTGTTRVGSRLTADPGTWTPAARSFSYRWLRDGRPTGVTSRTYPVSAADVGSRLRVVVVAARPGSRDGTATSAPSAVVGKRASSTRVAARGKAGGRAVVVVRVRVPGVTRPGGRLTVKDGSRVLYRGAVPRSGKVRLRLKRLERGTHVFRATYTGTASIAQSSDQDRARVRR